MSIITKVLKMECTVWRTTGAASDAYGKKKVVRTALVKCRWEDKQELFIDSEGEERMSKAVIMIEMDLAPGSYIYLGTPSEASSVHPSTIKGAFVVRSFEKLPNIRVSEYLRTVRV